MWLSQEEVVKLGKCNIEKSWKLNQIKSVYFMVPGWYKAMSALVRYFFQREKNVAGI